jgi:hypothetical protein
MRLYTDRPDILTAGAWHWCPPGAVEVPYWSAFVSSVWDYWLEAGDVPAVGEVTRGAWTNGAPDPRFTGKTFCGGADAWLRGVPFGTPHLPLDPGGAPVCCGLVPSTGFCVLAENGDTVDSEQGPGCVEYEH